MVRKDLTDIANIVNAAITPLMTEVQSLKIDVKLLTSSHVTKEDLEKFVPLSNYEPRHKQLEDGMRFIQKQMEDELDEIHKELKEDRATQMSKEDKMWVRGSQIIGIISIIIALISLLLSAHIHFG